MEGKKKKKTKKWLITWIICPAWIKRQQNVVDPCPLNFFFFFQFTIGILRVASKKLIIFIVFSPPLPPFLRLAYLSIFSWSSGFPIFGFFFFFVNPFDK